MRPFARAVVLTVAFGLVAASCKRTEDEAARQRIFSPEEPVGALAGAKEPIDARRLADDPQLARRVLHMTQEEAAARLGPHKAQTRVQFAWFRGPGLADGGSEVSLAEETTLADGPHGDFTVKLSNDRNQGFEIDWVNGQAFVKSLYGPFRKRRTDRTDPIKLREQALAALPSFDRLARGLKLKLAGETTVDGRKVLRYAVAGSGAGLPQDDRGLPPAQFPEAAGGKGAAVDPDTARRLELFEKEEPGKISGTVLIDAETGVPLACDLQGHFKVPAAGQDAGPAAELDLHSVLVTQAIGKDPRLKEPQFEPEPSVPHAVKDPLRFLGKTAPTPPGAASTEEPVEEEAPDEEQATPDEPAKPAPAPRPAKEPKPR
jgi:hypothetical protein